MDRLTTTKEVIEALGGIKAVMGITSSSYPAVHNWKSFPTFPANMYVAMIRELQRKGLSAPPSLWGMRESDENSVAAPCQEGAR